MAGMELAPIRFCRYTLTPIRFGRMDQITREKGKDMEAEGAQTPNQRRKTNSLGSGSPEPKPLAYPTRERTGRITSSPHTDGFDTGYADPRRPQSSAVRRAPTGSTPQVTPTAPTPAIPRRQQVPTRQLSPTGPAQKVVSPPHMKGPKRNFIDWLKEKHWLFLIGLGMITMIVLWLIGSAVLAWGTQRYYDVRYGNPRTYQTDIVVGHGGDSSAHPSHFIAVNLNGKIEVIEIPGGDPSKSQIYIGPQLFGAGSDLTPVTLSFEDCSGSGKVDVPDMELHIQGSDKLICFPNNGKTFTSTSGQH